MKKCLAILLILALCLCAPAFAEADAVEDILYVGGIPVTAENQSDIFGDGTAIYAPDSHTLYLKSAKIYRGSLVNAGGLDAVAAIYAKGDLTIHIDGECQIGAFGTDETDSWWNGIRCDGSLSFAGSNSQSSTLLVVACDAQSMTRANSVAAIQSAGGMRFSNCMVQAGCGTCDEAYVESCCQYGVFCGDKLEVKNAAILGFTSEQELAASSTGVCTRVLDCQGGKVIGMSGNCGFAFSGMMLPDEYTDAAYLAMFCTVASGDHYDGSDAAQDSLNNYIGKSPNKKFVAIQY